jgi:hypothetical protein
VKRPAATFVSIDKADEQRCATDAGVKLFHDLDRFGNKSRFEDKVLRRITCNGKFGSNDQIGTGGSESLVRLSDPGEVTRQIANRGIDLGEPDFHAPNAN